MKVLTINTVAGDYEFHMLNVGDHFPGFGGSRQGLVVGESVPPRHRTASLIVRRISEMGAEDTEYDIHDARPWRMICRCINDPTMEATGGLGDELVKQLMKQEA